MSAFNCPQDSSPLEFHATANTSLSAHGFQVVMALIIFLNCLCATVFVVLGGWPVLVFLGLDVLGIYVAFRLNRARLRSVERISICGEELVVERSDAGGAKSQVRLPAYWASVSLEGDEERPRVLVRSHGHSIEIGATLSPIERKDFGLALKQALFAWRSRLESREFNSTQTMDHA